VWAPARIKLTFIFIAGTSSIARERPHDNGSRIACLVANRRLFDRHSLAQPCVVVSEESSGRAFNKIGTIRARALG